MEAVRIVSGLGFVAAFFTGAILSVLFFERAKTVRRGQRFSLLVVGDGVKAKLLRNGIKPL